MNAAAAAEEIDPRKLYSKISRRLIPYIFILYILAYLDRVNVGFAAVEFKRDLHLSASVYGFGGAVYFLGQMLFDLPSNLFLQRVGPRRWIARIMISWGIIATGMMFVAGTRSFFAMRFLLGISEAGFFPGMILYLTFWFPSHERARAIAKFMTATSLAGVVGAELSRVLMQLDGKAGLHGWQWLFLVEGVPSILLGISVLFVLKDGPGDASWLSKTEKQWLEAELRRDRELGGAARQHRLKDAFKLPLVWILAIVFMLSQIGVYTINLWMPLILGSFLHLSGTQAAVEVGRFGTIPYLAAAICTVLVGWSSDRFAERRWHIFVLLAVSSFGFVWAAYAHSFASSLAAFTLAAIGCWSMMGPFWALPTRVLGGRAAAGGVALITMVGSLGGFSGPYLTGLLKDWTHTFTAGLLLLSALILLGGILCLTLREPKQPSAT